MPMRLVNSFSSVDFCNKIGLGRWIDLPSERISLRKTPDIRITYSPNRRAMICICTPRSPHGGEVLALLASRSVKVDADRDLVEIDLRGATSILFALPIRVFIALANQLKTQRDACQFHTHAIPQIRFRFSSLHRRS